MRQMYSWSVLCEALTGELAQAPLESCTLARLLSLTCTCVSLSGIAGVCFCMFVHVCVQMRGDSVYTVQSAMLHYFLCVLLNLFTPGLAPPVIRVRSAALACRAEPGLHSSLPVCCHLTPLTANLIQQNGDNRNNRVEKGGVKRKSTKRRPSNGSNKAKRENKEKKNRKRDCEQYLKPNQTEHQTDRCTKHILA